MIRGSAYGNEREDRLPALTSRSSVRGDRSMACPSLMPRKNVSMGYGTSLTHLIGDVSRTDGEFKNETGKRGLP